MEKVTRTILGSVFLPATSPSVETWSNTPPHVPDSDLFTSFLFEPRIDNLAGCVSRVYAITPHAF